MQSVGSRIAMLLVAGLLLGSVQASEPVFVTEDPDVLLEISDETRLEISGITGTLSLRLGTEGELRYAARTLDNLRSEVPVELWLEERTLLLVPLEGNEDQPVLVEVGLPPGLDVIIDATDSRVTASNLQSSFEVRGERLNLQAGAVAGSISLEILGGEVTIKNAGDDVDLQGKQLDVDIQGVAGTLNLGLEQSTAIVAYTGELEADLQETELIATSIDGPVNLTATGGKVDLEQCSEGGELRLSGSELMLKSTRGVLQVNTDTDMIFHDHNGELRVNGYGASVRGSKLEGLLEIETDSGDVILDSLDGQVNVQGRELNVQMTDARGPVEVTGSYSSILVDRAKSTVRVRNDYGEIEIRDALQTVAVMSVEDEIRISGLKGALQLEAEGSDVDVTWAALPADVPSLVENDRGDVRLTLPANGTCQVQANAPYGRVDSSIPGVKVSDDGHSASGLLSRSRAAPQVKRSVVRVRAGGDIFLQNAKAPPRGQKVPAPRQTPEGQERRRP